MNAEQRAKRDAAIVRAIKSGQAPRAVAIQHKLTLARVTQIVARESARRHYKRRQKG